MCGCAEHAGHGGWECCERRLSCGAHRYAFGCCCETDGPRVPWHPGMRFRRRFATREERIARLEEYLRDLQAEAKAVEERLAQMKA